MSQLHILKHILELTFLQHEHNFEEHKHNFGARQVHSCEEGSGGVSGLVTGSVFVFWEAQSMHTGAVSSCATYPQARPPILHGVHLLRFEQDCERFSFRPDWDLLHWGSPV